MFKLFQRLKTNNLKKVPLFWVVFDYQLFKENGKKGSCACKIHPELRNDIYVKKVLNDLIDYIRDNYDMRRM